MRSGLLLALLAGLLGAAPVWAEDTVPDTIEPGTLSACLPRNSGVIAGRRAQGGSGFDYRIAEEVAARLGLSLSVIWFENELEEESDPVRETYAMLAHRLCDIVPGHPRYESAVGAPGFDRAALPRWLGMPREIDARTNLMTDKLAGFVDVEPVAVSAGYMRSTIGLLYRDGTAEPAGLDDLGGRALAFQQGTLSGAIVMMQIAAEDRARARHFNPGAGFLWNAEASDAPLAIVDVAAFDSHRKSNPGTAFRLAGWRHAIGMDIGIATLAANADLLARIDTALEAIKAEGLPETLATAEGLTYTPPASDQIAQPFTTRTLLSTR